MKKHTHFLRKLTAVTLGFVMTLGVGAAGYAASAGETRAAGTKISASCATTNTKTGVFKDGTTTIASWTFAGTFGSSTSQMRANSGSTLTIGIESGYSVSKFGFGTNSTNDYLPNGTYSVDGGANASFSKPSSGTSFEVTMSSSAVSSVVITFSNNVRLTSINITYDTGSTPTTSYTVSFNNGGGTSSMTALTNQTSIQSAPNCTFTAPSGKEFSHWSTSSGGSAATFPMTLTSNITLYAVWKDSGSQPSGNNYQIVFKVGSGDGSGVSTSTAMSAIISSGSSYVSGNVVTATKLYYGGDYGLKLGTGSDSGTIRFNLSDAGKVKATSIVVRAKRYSSSKATNIKVNGSANQGLTSDFANYTFTQSGTTAISYIEIVSSKGTSGGAYCWISDITVNYAPTVVHTVGSISGASEVYVGKTATYTTSCDQSDGITWSVESGSGTASINSSTGVLTGGTAGTVTVKGTCAGGASSTKTVTIINDVETLVSIAVSGQKTTFTKGNNFSFGGTVTGTYSHTNGDPNSTKTISSDITYTIDGSTATTSTTLNDVGNHSVVVSAGGKSATAYNISVNYADVEAITLAYSENTIGKGAEATLPGVTISPANANQGSSWGSPVPSDDGIDYSFEPSTNKLTISNSNNVAGTISFTATATGDSTKTATVIYTVEVAQIAHITAVNALATGTIIAKQYVGDEFNPQGFSFEPVWSDGEHDPVIITGDDIQWNALVANQAPTGTYSCSDGNFTVTISGVTVANDVLASIEFENGCDMTNKSYWEGDSWNFAGLSIVGTMDSGKTASLDASKVSFTTTDPVSAGTTSITVTAHYQGFSGIEPTKVITGIQVQTPEITDLVVNYTGGQPTLGDDFVFAGTIKANMSHGPQQDVDLSDVTIGEVNKFITTQQTITVTHNVSRKTGTFNVQYKVASYSTMSEDTHVYSYDKVTSSQTEWRGKYLIVYETGKLAMDGSLETLDVVSNTKSVTISNNSITTDADGKINGNAIYFTVDYKGTSTSIYSLKSASGKYISGTTTSAKAGNGIKQADTPDDYEITFSGTELQSKSSDQQMAMKYNKANDQTRFRFYKSGQEAVALYKWTDHVTPGHEIPSDEKHAIRIGNVSCNKSPLIAGETISASDFKIQVQYDTGTSFTDNLTPTSVSPSTLVAGTNTYTITYTGSYNDTVIKQIQLTAQNPAVLESIYVTKDTGSGVFTRGDAFNTNGIHVWAHYTDSTTYPDVEVTSKATITPVSVEDMNVAGTKTVNVSYTEGSTQTSSYEITVNIKNSTYVTISGDGIEGSAGSYSLDCGPYKEVQLTLDKNGDEAIVPSTLATFLSYNESTGVLTVNSSAAVSETGTITFTSGNASATLTVNVTANPLTSFVATGTPSAEKQFRNSSFVLNLDGVTINGVYLDGTSTEFAASQFTWDTTGEHPVGTYKENENLTVIVDSITLADDSIKSISFVSGSDMSNKNYWVGEDWDYNGLSLTGEMESGLTAILDPSKISYSANKTTENSMEDGSITVTGHYQGFDGVEPTLVVNGVNVTAIQMTYLTVNYTGGNPYLGDDFHFAGTITAHYNNGDTETVSLSDVTIDAVDKFTTDQQTITVTHKTTGATGTFNVTYKLAQYWETEPIQHHYSYKLVTEDLSDWSGQYLIVYEDDNNSLAFDGSLTAVDSTPNTFEVGIVNNEIVPTDEINGKCFTIAKSSEGKYSIKNAAGYYIGRNASSNGIDGSKTYSSSYDNTISYSDGTFTITGNGGRTLSFNNASGQMKFRYLGSTLIKLYKYVDTPTGGGKVPSEEKHPIRIVDANLVDNTSVLIGDKLTKDDFNISVQYDTSVTPVSEDKDGNKIIPTSIQKKIGEDTYSNDCTLSAGDNIFKLTYYETYDDVDYVVTYEITVKAAEKTLNSISLSYGDSFKNEFGINDTFTHEGVIVTANYANGYDSEDVTNNENVSFSTPDMTTAGEKTITVTYIEDGVQKATSYTINVTAEKEANLISFTSENTGATATLVDSKSATFTGYVGNTVSFEIKLVNFGSDVNVSEKTAVDGLSLSGSIANDIYSGEIEISKVMTNQTYTVTVSDGEKDIDIVLSFSAIEDFITSIETTNYQEEYTVGDDFNYDMTVTATYASGSTRVLEDAEYDVAFLELTRGTHNVTVTLNGSTTITDTFQITVSKPDNLNIVTTYEIPIDGSYQLVTDASTLSSGDTILIVGIEDDKYYSLAPYESGNNCKRNEVETPVDDVIGGTCVGLTLGESSGAWTIYDGTYYLYAAGASSSNHLKGAMNANEDTAKWTISIDSDGVATIKCVASISRNWIMHNTGSDLFSCYASGQADVYIYRYVAGVPDIGYANNTEISDALFDFVYAWGGDNLSIANWEDIFESSEYAALNADDKALLQKAVVESEDHSKVTSDMFADFITTYDEIVAKYGPSFNELDRDVEYEMYNLVYENTGDAIISDGSSSDYYQAGSEITLPTDVKKEGYTFKGWFTKDGTSTDDWGKQETGKFNIHEDVTLYAKWEINKYTVTWKNGDAVLETDTNVPYGTTPKYNGTTPTKPSDAQYDYTFSGWSPVVSAVTGDVTYVAQFASEVRSYTVTWENYDGSTIKTDTVKYGTTPSYDGETPTKPSDAQNDYTFSGWSPVVSEVTGDVTYVAQFASELRSYTVTWTNYDGSTIKTDTVKYGTTPSFDGVTPIKPSDAQNDYTFSGWSPEVSAVTGDVTYVAQFASELRSYTVTWTNYDGSTIKTDTVKYGTRPEYNGETPTKPSTVDTVYIFDGWDPEINEVTGDVVYTATFKEEVRKYYVTWIVDGVQDKREVAYGEIPEYGSTPTKPSTPQYDYVFVGWTPAVVEMTGDVTYTAVFRECVRSYTITFMSGTTELQSTSYEYGSIPHCSVTPTSDNGVFIGWDKTVSPVTREETYTALFREIDKPDIYEPIERENYDSKSEKYVINVTDEFSDVKGETVLSGADSNGTVIQNDKGEYAIIVEAGEYKKFVEADIVLLNETSYYNILASENGIDYVPFNEFGGEAKYVKFVVNEGDIVKGLLLLRRAAGTLDENAYGYVSYTYHDDNTVSNIYAGIAFEFVYEDERLSQYQNSDEYTVMFIYGYSDSEMEFDDLWNSSYSIKLIGDDKLITNHASLVLKFKGTDTAKFDRVYYVAIIVIDNKGNLVDYSNVVSGSFNNLKYSIAEDHAEDPNLDHILLALAELGVEQQQQEE